MRAPLALLATLLLSAALAGPAEAAPETPTPTTSPTVPLTPSATPTITRTPTVTPTPTITPTATPVPPTPTVARPTPAPSGYFVPVYQGQVQAPGMEQGVVRGRVLDYRGTGIGSFPISAKTSGIAYSTATGPDGVYALSGLKPGLYSVAIVGYPGMAAEAIYLGPGAILSMDFVEAARPGAEPTAAATPSPSDPGAEASARGKPSVLVVVLTPEGASPARPARPTATTTPAPDVLDDLALSREGSLQAFAIGVAGCLGVAVLGLIVGVLRR